MKKLCGEKVNNRLISKLYKDQIFYYVGKIKGEKLRVKKCILSQYENDFSNDILVRFINDDFIKEDFRGIAGWEQLYLTYKEAKKYADEFNKKFSLFDFDPYLSVDIINNHFNELIFIQEDIKKKLKGYKNFLGIDFCDVSAGGIQIRGHHSKIKGYTYGTQPTIKYDFSNYEECIKEFVLMWWEHDNDNYILKEKEFISFGEKYDWD